MAGSNTPTTVDSTSPESVGVKPVGGEIDKLVSRVVSTRKHAMAGVLAGLSMALAGGPAAADSTANEAVVVAQATVNPEYEKIIAEAKAAGKDPVDYALSKGKTETFAAGLDSYIIKKVATERRTREAELDKAATRAIAENNAIAIKLIGVIDTNRKKGVKPTSEELEHLKKIYNRKETSEEVRKLIQEKFGDLFDFRMLMAQA